MLVLYNVLSLHGNSIGILFIDMSRKVLYYESVEINIVGVISIYIG